MGFIAEFECAILMTNAIVFGVTLQDLHKIGKMYAMCSGIHKIIKTTTIENILKVTLISLLESSSGCFWSFTSHRNGGFFNKASFFICNSFRIQDVFNIIQDIKCYVHTCLMMIL